MAMDARVRPCIALSGREDACGRVCYGDVEEWVVTVIRESLGRSTSISHTYVLLPSSPSSVPRIVVPESWRADLRLARSAATMDAQKGQAEAI